MSQAQFEIGKNLELTENEDGNGDGKIKNTLTGATVELSGSIEVRSANVDMNNNEMLNVAEITMDTSQPAVINEVDTINGGDGAGPSITLGDNEATFENGTNSGLQIRSGQTRLRSREGQTTAGFYGTDADELQVKYEDGGFDFQSGAPLPGTLELTNAFLDMNGNTITSVSSIEDTDSNARLTANSGATNLKGETGANGLSVNDSADIIQTFVGKFDISPGDANLRLAEGTKIEDDDNGTIRFNISPNRTTIHDQTGETVFKCNNGYAVQAIARSGTPFHIFDEEAATPAVRYFPSSDIGELEFNNARIMGDVEFGVGPLSQNNDGLVEFHGQDVSSNAGESNVHVEMGAINTGASGWIAFQAGTDNSEARIRSSVENGFEIEASNTTDNSSMLVRTGALQLNSDSPLLIDKESYIGNRDGTPRIEIDASNTAIKDEGGTDAIRLTESFSAIDVNSSKNLNIYDQSNSHTLVRFSSGNPGTLSLLRSDLDHGDVTEKSYSYVVADDDAVNTGLGTNELRTALVSIDRGEYNALMFITYNSINFIGKGSQVGPDLSVTQPTGTTGTDGDLSFAVDSNSELWVENRTGGERKVSILGFKSFRP